MEPTLLNMRRRQLSAFESAFQPIQAFFSRTFGNPDVYVIDVKFNAEQFIGSLTPGPESKYSAIDYDKAYSHEGFEPAVIFNPIRTSPSAEGFKASIPVFDLTKGSQMFWPNIEVVGREKIKVDGETYDTFEIVSKGIRKKTLRYAGGVPYPLQMATQGFAGI